MDQRKLILKQTKQTIFNLNKGNINMKTKALVTLTLLLVSGLTLASGGRDINNIDVQDNVSTNVEITKLNAQGPLDAFNVNVGSNEKIDTSSLKQSYDGKS